MVKCMIHLTLLHRLMIMSVTAMTVPAASMVVSTAAGFAMMIIIMSMAAVVIMMTAACLPMSMFMLICFLMLLSSVNLIIMFFSGIVIMPASASRTLWIYLFIQSLLCPIICVGELKDERESGYTDTIVEYQTLMALHGLTDEQIKNAVIAYEPVWAIGTGLTATDEQANETIGVIRKAVARKYGQDVADAVRIQYGGSMNPKNVKGLMAQPEIDGGLIGGASLKAPDFTQVVLYNK